MTYGESYLNFSFKHIKLPFKYFSLTSAFLNISTKEYRQDKSCLKIIPSHSLYETRWCPTDWGNVQLIDIQRLLMRTLQSANIHGRDVFEINLAIFGLQVMLVTTPVNLIVKYTEVENRTFFHLFIPHYYAQKLKCSKIKMGRN